MTKQTRTHIPDGVTRVNNVETDEARCLAPPTQKELMELWRLTTLYVEAPNMNRNYLAEAHRLVSYR